MVKYTSTTFMLWNSSSLSLPQLDQLHVLYLGSEYSEQGGSCGTKSHSDGMLKPHYISREHQMVSGVISEVLQPDNLYVHVLLFSCADNYHLL